MSWLKGRVISVSGIDGSGKTTIIDHIIKEFDDQDIKASYVWLRYNHYFTKLLLVLCRFFGLTTYKNFKGGRVGYHHFYKSKIISFLFVLLTWIDTMIATLVTVYIPAFFGKTVVCDRWVPDILIDLTLDTRWALDVGGVAYKWFYKLVPASATLIMVDREFAAIHDAREEHRYDKHLSERYALYARLKESGKCRVIDNTKDIYHTIDQVKRVVI